MLLSIIIPAYQVEAYIGRCLQSLLYLRDYEEQYEVIVVDDGSTDGTAGVVRTLQVAAPHIRLLQQANQGVSAARNAGIDAARGTYLLFVDADDFLLPGVLENGLHQAIARHHEIFSFGIQVNDSMNQTAETIRFSAEDAVFTGTEAYAFSRKQKSSVPEVCWGRLYKLDLIQKFNIRFTPGIAYLEDGEFIAKCFCVAERCGFSTEVLYVRTTRPGSAMNSGLVFKRVTLMNFLVVAKQLRIFQQQPFLTVTQQMMLNQPTIKYTLLPFQFAGISALNLLLAEVHRLRLIKLPLQNVVEPYRTLAAQFNRSPYWFWVYWKIRRIAQALAFRLNSN